MGEQRRGRKLGSEEKKKILNLIAEALEGSCRLFKACDVVGISERTHERWIAMENLEDQRKGPNSAPQNKFTTAERSAVLQMVTSPDFRDMSPHQIVPHLADQGKYLASESTIYRILRSEELLCHRGKAKPRSASRPKAYEAVRPNQIYSWDITYLMSSIRGQYFYLYLFLDVYSRKIVGWEVYDRESAELSSELLVKICSAEHICKNQLIVHSDNGSPMKGATMLATMQSLGVVPSLSRPSVSNDNPFSESLFKTLKYCPQYPNKPFAIIEEAKKWVGEFVQWYNREHLHSGINFVTPESRHNLEDKSILESRKNIYNIAREKNPNRWSRETRNWQHVAKVKLNCLKDEEASTTKAKLQLAN